MTKKKNPLVDFAEKVGTPGGSTCSVCLLPERATIDEARRHALATMNRAGRCTIGGATVRRWLIAECGYTEETAPSTKGIQAHFTSKHDLETA